ncbi:MAG: glycosyltransferase [Lachnospiraceae bacterium]|nr:glycosyltransferase [Lachnospiraceae bacterium]
MGQTGRTGQVGQQVGKEKNFISCVVYLHNDEAVVRNFLDNICGIMQENFEKYEIICVNDGCTDGTVEEIHEFLEQMEASGGKTRSVSLINLSFYQGVETAMSAGGDLAVGDFLFEFDRCCLDFEPGLIMDVYRRALEGYDVVSAAPKRGVSFSSRLFYALYNWSSHFRYRIRQERFRVVSRRAVNRVNQMNVYVPYRKVMYMNCGLKTDTLVYDNKDTVKRARNREEQGSRSGLAVDTLIIFTDVLEKFSLWVSVILLGFMVMMFFWIIYSIFSTVRPVEGWMSLMALMSFGFFMLSVMLTLIFKYLSVILNMSFRKQRYVVEGVEKLTK